MLFVSSVGHERGNAYYKWVQTYSTSTGRKSDLEPTDDRTISLTTRSRPTGKAEEHVRAIWHFDENDRVTDISIERNAIGT